jgi:hypothetical protein
VIVTLVKYVGTSFEVQQGCPSTTYGAPRLVHPEGPAGNLWVLRPIRISINLILVFGLLAGSWPLTAQWSISAEYQSKARALVNLPNFIEWPDSAFPSGQSSFSVCVLGDFRFGISLAELAKGRTTHGRPIEIHGLKKDEDIQACQILYISQLEAKRYAKILDGVRGSNKLTVGETPNFLDAGGALVLSFEPEGLRFDVNLRATKAAHLKISSNLLALARRVLNSPETAKS